MDTCDVSHLGLVISIIKNKYDIINVHNPSSFFIIPFILKKLKLTNSKIIFVCHGLVRIERKNQAYNYPKRYSIYQKICLLWSDHIIAVSKYLKSSIVNEYGINENKISVIHNGVEDKFFTKELASFADYSQYILFVGTINKMKGLDFLLSAVQKINNYNLILIGKETSYLHELESKYSNLFNSKKVIHLGEIDTQKLLSAYSSAKFLVVPSYFDSYSMVVLEAMAAGKPVIISDNVGAKEIIENGKEGFIVNFGDVDSLTNVILYLLNNEKEVKVMGQFAKQKALENTWCIKAKEYLKIFEGIIDGKVF